jgi:hypothetical protein
LLAVAAVAVALTLAAVVALADIYMIQLIL